MPSGPTRFLFPRRLPHVDPLRRRSALQRASVAVAGSRVQRWLSKTALWRNTVWKLEPHLQRLTGGRLTTAIGLPTALLETRGARTVRWRVPILQLVPRSGMDETTKPAECRVPDGSRRS